MPGFIVVEGLREGFAALTRAVERFSKEDSPQVVKKTVDFTPNKSDSYFGEVVSLINYEDTQRLFSNSGWSIDNEGLYLSSDFREDHRLTFLDKKISLNPLETRSISWFFKVGDFVEEPGTSPPFILSLWDFPLVPVYSWDRRSVSIDASSYQDYAGDQSHRGSVVNPNLLYNLVPVNSYLKVVLNLDTRLVSFFLSDSTYSEFIFLSSMSIFLKYSGIVYLGFSGSGSNGGNRLRKIVVEGINNS